MTLSGGMVNKDTCIKLDMTGIRIFSNETKIKCNFNIIKSFSQRKLTNKKSTQSELEKPEIRSCTYQCIYDTVTFQMIKTVWVS